jgi:hypothetical protein
MRSLAQRWPNLAEFIVMPLVGGLAGAVLGVADLISEHLTGTEPSATVKLSIAGLVTWNCARRWERLTKS